MRVGDVLDRSFELLRREWRAAVLLGGVYVVGFVVLIGTYSVVFFRWVSELGPLDAGANPDPELLADSIAGAAGFVVSVVVFAVLMAFASLVLTGVSVRAAMHGPEEGTGWSELWGHLGPATIAGLRLLGWGILVGLGVSVLFVIPFVFLGLVVGTGSGVDGDAGVAITVLFTLGFVFVVFAASVAVGPILMAMTGLVYGREAGVWRSIGDGYRLVRRAYWPSVGATVIVWLFSLVPLLGSVLVTVLMPPFQVALIERLEAAGGEIG
jgi:hypothetical protein